MAGGLRHTTAQIKELETTDSWIRAFGEALAYLIRQTPNPKDKREKQVRARVLLSIRNALRVTKVRPSLARPGDPFGSVEPPKKPEASPTPPAAAPEPAPPVPEPITALRVDVVIPTGPVPSVRPGTTAGDPFTLDTVAKPEADE